MMRKTVAWILLLLAIIFEVVGITSMKLSEGFRHLWPSLGIFFFYSLSLCCLTLSLKRLEVGLAYAIWSALGTLLILMIGVSFFSEPITILKSFSLMLIIVGVMGLKQV